MKFTNFKNQLERPYIVFADMESTLIKLIIQITSTITCPTPAVLSSFAHMTLLRISYGMTSPLTEHAQRVEQARIHMYKQGEA